MTVAARTPKTTVGRAHGAVGSHRSAGGQLRLVVDPVTCDAYGYCAELLGELVDLDEWGYPVVAGDGLVPAALVDRVRAAVRQCPRRALILREVRL